MDLHFKVCDVLSFGEDERNLFYVIWSESDLDFVGLMPFFERLRQDSDGPPLPRAFTVYSKEIRQLGGKLVRSLSVEAEEELARIEGFVSRGEWVHADRNLRSLLR